MKNQVKCRKQTPLVGFEHPLLELLDLSLLTPQGSSLIWVFAGQVNAPTIPWGRRMGRAIKSYSIKLVMGITHSRLALERSVINNWGELKSILQAPNLSLIFCSGSQHLVS